MIRSPLSLRLDPAQPIRDQIRLAAEAGARGIVVEASEELAPSRLSETGRRELRHLFRSSEMTLVAVHLPTRRGFDTFDQIEDRVDRAGRVFDLVYDLGARLVLVRTGAIPDVAAESRRAAFTTTVTEMATRADHRGLQMALETGTEPGDVMHAYLTERNTPNLVASVDPAALLRNGFDPVAAVRDLGQAVGHAYLHQPIGPEGSFNLGKRGNSRQAASLDWENYFGALEEINYRGTMTIWPESTDRLFAQYRQIAESLRRI